MSRARRVVVDANVLVRATFGKRVYAVMKNHEGRAEFYAPDICVEEARRNALKVAKLKRIDPAGPAAFLAQLMGEFLLVVDRSLYEAFEEEARRRIARRDPDDWPVVATALLLDAPLWTEDQDFFGAGLATWTTDRIELYLRGV
jgi:predicted nucleic acid-binding protein